MVGQPIDHHLGTDGSGSLLVRFARPPLVRKAAGAGKPLYGLPWGLSKVQSVDQRMRLECGVGFRQLRTCRRTRPGQLCFMNGHI